MHDIAVTVGPSAVILIGIIAGILFNQRALVRFECRVDTRFDKVEAGIDRIESRLDRFETRIDRIKVDLGSFRSIGAIEMLEKRA